MYCKLFASLYQGTLRGKPHEILVFTNLLANADKDGMVDKHFRAVAEEIGLTVDEVKSAIALLEAPDEESRSVEQEGRRLVRVAENRSWGWQIVNYAKYRAIRSDDDRREQNRIAQQKWRDKAAGETVSQCQPPSATVSRRQLQSAQGEGKGEGEGEAYTPKPPRGQESVDSVINEIYQSYPRKESKPLALKAIRKALETATSQEIMAGINRWIPYWKTRDPQFTPLPATFFNQEKWNDTPPVIPAATPAPGGYVDCIQTAPWPEGAFDNPFTNRVTRKQREEFFGTPHTDEEIEEFCRINNL